MRDTETRKELTELVGLDPKRPPAKPRKPNRMKGLHKRQTDDGGWSLMPDSVREMAVADPALDVRLLYAHLAPRCRNVLDRYLAPEYKPADLDKLMFAEIDFKRLRGAGPLSVMELTFWHDQVRHIRAEGQGIRTDASSNGDLVG